MSRQKKELIPRSEPVGGSSSGQILQSFFSSLAIDYDNATDVYTNILSQAITLSTGSKLSILAIANYNNPSSTNTNYFAVSVGGVDYVCGSRGSSNLFCVVIDQQVTGLVGAQTVVFKAKPPSSASDVRVLIVSAPTDGYRATLRVTETS